MVVAISLQLRDQLVHSLFVFPALPRFVLLIFHPWHQLCHRLRKIHMDPPIVNNHVLHLQVRFFTRFLALEFDKSILQALPCLPVSYYLHALNGPKAGEDNFEIPLLSHWIQLADEKHVLGRLHIRIRQVSKHL